MATPRHMECRLGSSRLGGAEDRQYVSLRQLARARCRMRQGLISLLGTWWRSNQGKLEACRRELSQSLERETATSEVLGIISSSPSNLEPVFDTILANATRLCEAQFGILSRYDGDVFHTDGLHNVAPALAEYLRRDPQRPDPRNSLGRVLQTKQPVHIPDVTLEPAYAERERLRVTAIELA